MIDGDNEGQNRPFAAMMQKLGGRRRRKLSDQLSHTVEKAQEHVRGGEEGFLIIDKDPKQTVLFCCCFYYNSKAKVNKYSKPINTVY